MKKVLGTLIFTILLLPMIVNARGSNFYWDAEKQEDRKSLSEWKNDGNIRPASYSWVNNTYILYLKNYNGSGLYADGHKSSNCNYIVVLEGENIITSDKIGINTYSDENGNPVKLQFVGNGTLTINAPKPLSYEDYKDSLVINPSKNEMTVVTKQISEQSEESKTEEVTTEEEKTAKEITSKTNENKEDTTTKKGETIDYKLFFIISSIVSVILLVTTIILIIKKKK